MGDKACGQPAVYCRRCYAQGLPYIANCPCRCRYATALHRAHCMLSRLVQPLTGQLPGEKRRMDELLQGHRRCVVLCGGFMNALGNALRLIHGSV